MIDQVLVIFGVILVLTLLGAVVAFSPTLVITEFGVLIKSKKPFIHVVSLILGISVAIFVFSFLAVSFIDSNTTINFPETRKSIKLEALVDIILGVALVIFGIKSLTKSVGPDGVQKKSKFSLDNLMTSKKLFLFGLIKMATSVSSLLAILVAAKFVKTFLPNPPSQIVATIWLVAVSVAPFVLIASLKFVKPRLFLNIQNKFKIAPFVRFKKIIFIACVALGIVFILYGFSKII